jgi:prevent-host-death family protein
MEDAAETIGIRELRQNASRYVDMAERGLRVPVTKRGKLVAYLVPAEEPRSVFGQMVAAGQVRRATGPGIVATLAELGPPPPAEPGEGSPFEELMRMRDEERY